MAEELTEEELALFDILPAQVR